MYHDYIRMWYKHGGAHTDGIITRNLALAANEQYLSLLTIPVKSTDAGTYQSHTFL
jgi:hypothetical protein